MGWFGAEGLLLGRGGSSTRGLSASRAVLGVLALGALSFSITAPLADVNVDVLGASDPGRPCLVTFEARTAVDLTDVLERAWALAASAGEVPNVAPNGFPSDMGSLDAETRKQTFIRSLVPHVLEQNRRILEERRSLLRVSERLEKGQALSDEDRALLADLRLRYRVEGTPGSASRDDAWQVSRDLLCRVDEIPVALAVGQAAVESAWGTSRLALRENSLFGQFVFSSDDASPRVGRGALRPGLPARFRNIGEAVAAYSRNLNTYAAYEPFRKLRETMRGKARGTDPVVLAQGLLPYSELGQEYVENVRGVILGNALASVSHAPLARLEARLIASIVRNVASVAVLRSGSLPPAV